MTAQRTASRMSRELGDRGLASAVTHSCEVQRRPRPRSTSTRAAKRVMREKLQSQFSAVQRGLPASAACILGKSHRRQEAKLCAWGKSPNPKCSFGSRGEARTARCTLCTLRSSSELRILGGLLRCAASRCLASCILATRNSKNCRLHRVRREIAAQQAFPARDQHAAPPAHPRHWRPS